MDRAEPFLQHKKSASHGAHSSKFHVHSALFSPGSRNAPHAIFAPLHYEAGYAYPLLVWLHGPGDDERQLMRIMPMVSMRNFVAVAPRGVCGARDGTPGYGWQQSDEAISLAEARIFDSIEMVGRKFHVAPGRIFIAGFDAGGTMAFRLALSHPRGFAGAVSIGGPLPNGRSPFGNLVEARRVPLFLAVGRDSQQYPPSQACEHLRLLHTAGLSVTLRQYPVGHVLTPQMLGDVDRWIIEQITAGSAASDASPERE